MNISITEQDECEYKIAKQAVVACCKILFQLVCKETGKTWTILSGLFIYIQNLQPFEYDAKYAFVSSSVSTEKRVCLKTERIVK